MHLYSLQIKGDSNRKKKVICMTPLAPAYFKNTSNIGRFTVDTLYDKVKVFNYRRYVFKCTDQLPNCANKWRQEFMDSE
jgi:hypothetical protein